LLPRKLWLLGLGHLGQANAWLLRSMPWSEPEKVTIWLQDDDVVNPENVGTSMLSRPEHISQTKCRRVASALEEAGLTTKIIERRFEEGQQRRRDEAECAIAGFDSPESRKLLDDGRWSHLVDAGIGAGASSFTQFVLHRLNGNRSSRQIFDVPQSKEGQRLLSEVPSYRKEAEKDPCGALLLAEQAVGTSFVGLTAATAALAEILRPLHGGDNLDVLAGDLTRSPAELQVAVRVGDPPGVEAITAASPKETSEGRAQDLEAPPYK